MLASSISVGTALQVGVSVVAGFIVGLLGGWDTGLQTLLIFMLLDIITGMYVALIGKSHNSENGFYKSGVFGKGLFKKVLILVIVSLAFGVDQVLHTECLRDMTVVFFVINEAISILENSHCAGVPIPDKLVIMLEVYHEQFGHVAKEDTTTYRDLIPDVIHTKNRMIPKTIEKEWEEPTNEFKKEKP